ncbi:MAG: hypothetical protein SVR94_06320 [Pseudomonadota bacterium]|nr:hypothetical protein [Pseudomonadota bacterium]
MVPKKKLKNPKKRKKQPYKRKTHLKLFEYTITYEPLESDLLKQLPVQTHKRFYELHALITTQPKQVIAELSELIKEYPDIPQFYNFLAAAYTQIKDIENKEAIILACYEQFPDYLFGRLNYAELCLDRGELEKIPEIFEHNFDLKLLYPQRSEFHISEFVNFTGFVALYHLRRGKWESAIPLYNILEQLAPEHQITKKIEDILALLNDL